MSAKRKRKTQQFTLTEIINFQKDHQKLITNKEIQRTYKILGAILLPIENEQTLNNMRYLQLKKNRPYLNQIIRAYNHQLKNPQIVENHIKKLYEVSTIILRNLESVIQTIENKTKKTTQTNEIIESLTSFTPIEERITLFKIYHKDSTATKGFSIILTNMQHLKEILQLEQKREITYLKNWVTLLNTFYNRNNSIIETTEKTMKIIEEEHTLSDVLEVILQNNVYKDEGLIKTIIGEPIEQMRNLRQRGVKFEKTRKYNELNISHLL